MWSEKSMAVLLRNVVFFGSPFSQLFFLAKEKYMYLKNAILFQHIAFLHTQFLSIYNWFIYESSQIGRSSNKQAK